MRENEETRQGLTGGSRKHLADGEAAAIVAQGRLNRHTAGRCEPVACGPSTYGLTQPELRAEARRLLFDEGWQLWEVAARLALPLRHSRGRCA